MDMNTKRKLCAAFCAASVLLPGTALANYHGDSDTGTDALDFIENNRRTERENRLTDEQKKLLADTEAMKQQLKKPLDPAKKQLPVAIEGDDMFYDQKTGDVYAKGNVRITELDAKRFETAEAKGNLTKQDVFIEGKAHMLQLTPNEPKVTMDGYRTVYNYGTKTGHMEDGRGKVDHQYITGKRIEFYPDKVLIYNGTASKCGARKPDYYLSADTIEIYPNREMIMHHVKFWLGSWMMYQKNEYRVDISPGAKDQSPVYPRVGYDSDNGVWIEQEIRYPLASRLEAFADITYMTKYNFRNVYGVRWGNAGNSASVEYGHYEDSDNHWIKKKPTFKYSYTNRIGSWPFSYTLSYERGQWYKDGITSNHTYYGIGLSRDRITMAKTWFLSMSTGYSITKEDYNHSRVQGFSYNGTLVHTMGSRWDAYLGYAYSQATSQNSLFNYNVDDYSRKLMAGISYRFDDKNRIMVGENYDINNRHLKDVDWYWFHDIHCAQLIVRYRAKREKINFTLQFAPW